MALVAVSAAGAERHVNGENGLSFDLAAGADMCRSPAPQPKHRLLFRPAGVSSPSYDD